MDRDLLPIGTLHEPSDSDCRLILVRFQPSREREEATCYYHAASGCHGAFFEIAAFNGTCLRIDAYTGNAMPNNLGQAVSLIAGLLDALDGNYPSLDKLKAEADTFRTANWSARKDWWKDPR